MENHKRILGILFIISGVLKIIVMTGLMAFFSFIFPFLMQEVPVEDQWAVEWIVPLIQVVSWSVILLLAIPALIGGVGLLNHKPWALTIVLIVGCLNIFSFPFGTALGIYTIWVYAEDSKLKSNAA
jgi:hypothetical protein